MPFPVYFRRLRRRAAREMRRRRHPPLSSRASEQSERDPGAIVPGGEGERRLVGQTCHKNRPVVTGPRVREDDTEFAARAFETGRSVPATRARPGCPFVRPSANRRGRRECRALAATHGPPAERKAGGSHHRYSRHPAFPARWFTTYTRSPRGPACLPPSRQCAFAHCAWHQHRDARTPRLRRPSPARSSSRRPRPPLPASHFVTIGRNAPLHRARMRGNIVLICPTTQARRRATNWHDGQFANDEETKECLSGDTCRRTPLSLANSRAGDSECWLDRPLSQAVRQKTHRNHARTAIIRRN
jgi:hypothetical protein